MVMPSTTSSSSISSYSRASRGPRVSSPPRILRTQVRWEDLYFYKKTVVLDQLTFVFCQRFLPKYGDRTVDQMVQAARLGRRQTQNEEIAALKAEVASLKAENASLKRELAAMKGGAR